MQLLQCNCAATLFSPNCRIPGASRPSSEPMMSSPAPPSDVSEDRHGHQTEMDLAAQSSGPASEDRAKGTANSLPPNPPSSPHKSPNALLKRRTLRPSDDVVLSIASKVFINLRVKPDCLGSLWSVDDKSSVDLCKKVILESVFPDDGSIDTDLQLGRLLGMFVLHEVENCKDFETLLRNNSLAALLSSSYCSRKSAQAFLEEFLNPILKDVVHDPRIHSEESKHTVLLQQALHRIVSVICSKIHSLPIGLSFIAENIFAGLSTHASHNDDAQDVRELSAACAIGSIVFLRFIVPHVTMYAQHHADTLPSSEQASMQRFLLQLGSSLQKMSNGTLFPAAHKLVLLNETVKDLTVNVQSAFLRISSAVALERMDYSSSCKYALSSSIQADDLISFMKLLVSVKDTMVALIQPSGQDTIPDEAIIAAIDEFTSLSEQAIADSDCAKAGGSVVVPLADVSKFSLDYVLDDLTPPPLVSTDSYNRERYRRESVFHRSSVSGTSVFSESQLRAIDEAAMIVQDSISGRSFHNRHVASSNSRFDCLAPIALRLTRSIMFQRIILVLCLLHCFMAVYETRPFKEYLTRQNCLNAPVDEGNLQKIFASETVILAFYWAFFFSKVFSRSGKVGGWSLLQLFVTTVLTVDLIYNWVAYSLYGATLIRFGTPLRPVMQIVRTTHIAHKLRRHLHELYYTIMSAKYMFAIIATFCVIVGIIMQIFVRTVCAGCDTLGCVVSDALGSRAKMCSLLNTRFKSSGSSILTTFVIITASNYNSMTEMLISYMDQTENKSRALFLFFFLVIVVIVGYFLLFPILLAVVVSSYRKARQQSVDRDNASTQLALASAFSLLESVENSNGTISEHVYFSFMKACNLNFSGKEIALFFQYLDTDLSKSLSMDEFTQLLDIMSLSLRKGLSKRISHYFINLGTIGKGHIFFRNFVQSRRFRICMSLVICLNVCVYIWTGTLSTAIRTSDMSSSNVSHVMFSYDCVSDKYAWDCAQAQAAEILDFVLFLVYCTELLLSFFSFGLSSLFMPWVMFNFALIAFSSIFYILAYLGFGVSPVYVSVFRLVNLVRVLRMFDLSVNFKALMQSVRGSLRGFSSFIIFSVSTIFSWAFIALLMLQCNQVHGDYNPDNLPNGTPINFDSLTGSVLSLFQITVVDNWDDFIWSANEVASYSVIYSFYFLAFFLILVLVITNVLTSSIIEAYDEQVQLEEEKLKQTSFTKGSVFIDGVEFVKVGAKLSELRKISVSGRKRFSDSERTSRMLVQTKHTKSSHKKASSSVLATAETVDNRRVSFLDVSDTAFADAAMSPSPLASQIPPINEESDFVSQHLLHPSLIAKFGSLNVFKPSSGKLSPRWCNLSAAKLRIYARNNHSNLKQSIECGDIERVDDVLDSQDIVLHPIVLTFRKRKHLQSPTILSAPGAQEQLEWITVIRDAISYQLNLRNQQEAFSELERTWREYAYNCSKEASKVLKQLIDVLLRPIEDGNRYITVLEHLCWLADELGESEIVCPIVEYAAQLIPQLKHKLRSSKISTRSSFAPGDESDSSSDDSGGGDYFPRIPSKSQINAFSVPPRSPVQASPQVQVAGPPTDLSQMSFSSVLKAVKIERTKYAANAQRSATVVGADQRPRQFDYAHKAHPINSLAVLDFLDSKNAGNAAAASRNVEQAPDSVKMDSARGGGGAIAAEVAGTTPANKWKPAGLLAILAASAFRNAGDARAASRLSENALKAMKEDLAASEATDIELQELHGAAAPPHGSDSDNVDLEIQQLLTELDPVEVLPAVLQPPLNSVASQHPSQSQGLSPPPVTTSNVTTEARPQRSPRSLQLQQQEALAELQAAMMSLKPTSVQMHQSLVANSPQQQQHVSRSLHLQHRQHPPQTLLEEPSAPLTQLTPRTLQHERQQILAELQAVLKRPPHLASSSPLRSTWDSDNSPPSPPPPLAPHPNLRSSSDSHFPPPHTSSVSTPWPKSNPNLTHHITPPYPPSLKSPTSLVHSGASPSPPDPSDSHEPAAAYTPLPSSFKQQNSHLNPLPSLQHNHLQRAPFKSPASTPSSSDSDDSDPEFSHFLADFDNAGADADAGGGDDAQSSDTEP